MIEGSLGLGFALAAVAGCCYDGGYALQAYEARRAPSRQAMRPGLLAHLARRPIWILAIVISLLGWGFQLLALAHAPLTLVQPTLALGLLLLLFLGARFLHEPVGMREVAGASIIIVSIALVAWTAPEESGEVERGGGLAVALTLLAVVTVLPLVAARRGMPPVALLIVGAGAADGLAAFVAKLISEDAAAGRWGTALVWAATAGLAVLLGLLSESSALQRAAATRVAPAVLVLQIAIPVTLAPLVGGESWGGTRLGGAVLVAALVATGVGVAVMGSSPAVAAAIAEAPEPAEGAGAQP